MPSERALKMLSFCSSTLHKSYFKGAQAKNGGVSKGAQFVIRIFNININPTVLRPGLAISPLIEKSSVFIIVRSS